MTRQEMLADTLQTFKTLDEMDLTSIAWFKSSSDLARLILAWPKVSVTLLKSVKPAKRPTAFAKQWEWLWANYSFSYKQWQELAGVSSGQYITRMIGRLIRLRMVYPDNTLAKWLGQYVNSLGAHELARLRIKPTGTPAATPPQKSGPPAEDEMPEELEGA